MLIWYVLHVNKINENKLCWYFRPCIISYTCVAVINTEIGDDLPEALNELYLYCEQLNIDIIKILVFTKERLFSLRMV